MVQISVLEFRTSLRSVCCCATVPNPKSNPSCKPLPCLGASENVFIALKLSEPVITHVRPGMMDLDPLSLPASSSNTVAVPPEKITERIIKVPVEHLIEVPVDRLVERNHEVLARPRADSFQPPDLLFPFPTSGLLLLNPPTPTL